ncbi:TBC1 domain family member 10A isoform X4 [Manis javanica]|uniref:TBC1 domain family member 10A isoform X4 n=1 Tax=Manis javanica TaxID=9974 RepID=UPI003C6DB672
MGGPWGSWSPLGVGRSSLEGLGPRPQPCGGQWVRCAGGASVASAVARRLRWRRWPLRLRRRARPGWRGASERTGRARPRPRRACRRPGRAWLRAPTPQPPTSSALSAPTQRPTASLSAASTSLASSWARRAPRAHSPIQSSVEAQRLSHDPTPAALSSPSLTSCDCPRLLQPLLWLMCLHHLLEEVPLEVLRQRESKWLDMLNNWDKWMAKKHKKIRLRCQKGIPPSLRGRAWQYLSGGKVKLQQNPGKFDELDMSPGDPKWLDVIERDLHRQFPFHEMFVSRGGHGQQDLLRVLKAYTLYRPEEGYCQAQAPVAAVLLMHMPAEQAFWCLVQICEKYLPGYYSEKLEAIQLDGEILFSLLQKVSPVAHKHLSRQKIDPLLYMTEWFMCAFARTLPWSSVLRVWDMFFCEGVKIIFRVGLVLLKHALGSPEKLKACQGQYETIERLRSLSPKIMQEAFLVQEVVELPVTERQIEREHLLQLRRWQETRGHAPKGSSP